MTKAVIYTRFSPRRNAGERASGHLIIHNPRPAGKPGRKVIMKNVNIKEFAAKFNKNYAELYEADNVAGFAEAVLFFDEFVKSHGDFVGKFAKYRGDLITSDREAAAFAYALEDFALI